MRPSSLPILLLSAALLTHSCGLATEEPSASTTMSACLFAPTTEVDLRAFDIEQRTCALEVVMRPIALRVPDGIHHARSNKTEAPEVGPVARTAACT